MNGKTKESYELCRTQTVLAVLKANINRATLSSQIHNNRSNLSFLVVRAKKIFLKLMLGK